MEKYGNLLKYAPFVLTGISILALMTATILEKTCGTGFVMDHIYTSPAFILLWMLIAASGCILLFKRKTHKRIAVFGIHIAFLLILAGALTTHLWGLQGTLHLRQDEVPARSFTLKDGKSCNLPFTIRLNSFHVEYHPGTFAPMDFISTITIEQAGTQQEGTVAMNQIYTYHNYRFYQSGYDADEQGTTLSVSYDPYGISITYTGYLLLLISLLLFFAERKSHFYQLVHHPLLRKGFACCTFLLISGYTHAGNNPPAVLPISLAQQFGDLYVYYNNRICPLQTMAKDFTTKLYGKTNYKGYTPEQVLTGWFFFYDDWKHEPMIRIKGTNIQKMLDINGKYACLADFADFSGYKLEAALRETTENTTRKNIENANEKFNIISMATTGSLFKIYPYKGQNPQLPVWYSLADRLPEDMPNEQWIFIRKSMDYVAEMIAAKQYKEASILLDKIRSYQQKEASGVLPSNLLFVAEKTYNRMGSSRMVAIICILLGIISFVIVCKQVVMQAPGYLPPFLPMLFLGILLAYLSVAIILRGYISGHIPLSNGFETMQFMAWCSILLTLFLHRKFKLALPFGFLLCGLALMVASMGESNPQITPLIPVLSSPLLSIHVMAIMVAYSLFAFIMLNGLTAIIMHYVRYDCSTQIKRLQLISHLMLYPAVFLLAAGIFVGAVWANQSWGRYWGWDPKEVWALITMLVYAAALHTNPIYCLQKPMTFHIFSVIAFLSVIITYFGVNFLLGGLHGYA